MRAAGDARRGHAVDEDGRTLTFGEYRDAAERAAAGLAALGVGAGDVVVVAAAHLARVAGARRRARRLGAVQNPMLPIYRDREVGFITRQAGRQAAVVPVDVDGLRLRGDGASASPSDNAGGRSRCSSCDKAAARGRPVHARRRRPRPADAATTSRCAGSSTRRAPPPTRRARGTPTARSWRGASG